MLRSAGLCIGLNNEIQGKWLAGGVGSYRGLNNWNSVLGVIIVYLYRDHKGIVLRIILAPILEIWSLELGGGGGGGHSGATIFQPALVFRA